MSFWFPWGSTILRDTHLAVCLVGEPVVFCSVFCLGVWVQRENIHIYIYIYGNGGVFFFFWGGGRPTWLVSFWCPSKATTKKGSLKKTDPEYTYTYIYIYKHIYVYLSGYQFHLDSMGNPKETASYMSLPRPFWHALCSPLSRLPPYLGGVQPDCPLSGTP